MPALRDIVTIRAILEHDRVWSAYALGDLAPGFFEHCRWFWPQGDGGALALVYSAFTPAVLFAQGAPESLGTIVDEFTTARSVYLHVRPEMLPILTARYRIVELRRMWRMVLDAAAYRSAVCPESVRLSLAHQSSLEELYADGDAVGERPDFFYASMLDHGVFYGMWEAGKLAAVAGTHLVASGEDVAAIGNVYTRRDRRGRGLAARATSGVVDELLRMQIGTVVLNVNQSNAPAIRVYERLGFRRHCGYCEGVGER